MLNEERSGLLLRIDIDIYCVKLTVLQIVQ